ncbi:MAG TPA: sulfotransferase [Steroidobacteraceae bacterium]|nr:sulfotransferase [Steroidobacteraceae bacterium]
MHPTLTRTLRLFGLLEAGRRVELQLRLRGERALPDAMIIGAMKAGTSSLHNYLTQHPGVIAPLRKEVHYFDLQYGNGERWYRANFGPLGRPGLNLDSSPYYLFHPLAAQRAHALVPQAKLVVLLRDPIRRAYSHYWHERDKRRERLSFEDAIAAEPERVGDDEQRLARGEIQQSRAHQHCTYLARGRYAEQLERWLRFYPREQLLVLQFEDLGRAPMVTLNRTLEYLALPPMARVRLDPRNARKYPPINPATAERLREYFAPHDAALAALLGEPTRW